MRYDRALTTWCPPAVVLIAVWLVTAPAQAGLIIEPTEGPTGPVLLRATQLFGPGDKTLPTEIGWDVPDRLRLDDAPPQSGVLSVFAETDQAPPVVVPQRPAFLIGLTLFRSRTSTKWLRPVNDCDPWQLIVSRAAMVC